MGQDNTALVISQAKATAQAITNVGKVYDHVPGWHTANDMDDALVTIGDEREHRFVFIEHRTGRQALTNQSDIITHDITMSCYVAAKVDEDRCAESTAEAHALKSAFGEAFDFDKPVFIVGGEGLTYEEDGGPQEVGELEYRVVVDRLFHVFRIRVKPREEVTRA